MWFCNCCLAIAPSACFIYSYNKQVSQAKNCGHCHNAKIAAAWQYAVSLLHCMLSNVPCAVRVLPSRVPRNCFTIWLSEGRSRAAGASPSQLLPPPATGRPGGELWRFLMQPAVRQHVCKLAYAGEMAGLHKAVIG